MKTLYETPHCEAINMENREIICSSIVELYYRDDWDSIFDDEDSE